MFFPRLIVLFFSTCLFLISICGGFCHSHNNSSSYISSHPSFSVNLEPDQARELQKQYYFFHLNFNINSPWKISLLSSSLTDNNFQSLILPYISSLGSKNIENIQIEWPKPSLYSQENYKFSGYTGKFSVLLKIKKINVNQPSFLQLNLDYSLCADLCIPVQHTLSFELPVSHSKLFSSKIYERKTDHIKNFLNLNFQLSHHWIMLCWAFIGGIILNFMPCVLPVLSLKFLSLVKQQNQFLPHSSYRIRFLATFFGIMLSFLCLAILALSFKTLGMTLGWGMHFQQPLFLMILIFFLTLFANSLWGFYDIILPEKLNSKLNTFFKNSSDHHHEFFQDFLLGIFATLLATPCTAPFLGTALGYAFSQSNFDILLFFIVLGLGFSLPYWIGACLPAKWLKLPKSGRWMIRVSHLIGLILSATILWLIWILNEVGSLYQSVLTATAMTLMTYLFWIGKEKPRFKKFTLVGILTLMSSLFVFSIFTKNETPPSILPLQQYWQIFEPFKIPQLITQGKTVVVDITAAWCLTCKINKLVIFKSPQAQKMLSDPKIIYMQGDWTNHQSEIANYIAEYGRAGIPFTIVFGPQAPQGILLPEIQTFERLKKAILNAQGEN